jgi:TrmH family RNA methyltransferase
MTRLSITSTANDRLKTVRRLHRRRDRGVFLVEGHGPLRHALAGGATVREIYAAPELFLGRDDARIVALAERRGAHVYELSADAFSSISRSVRPDGLAAIVERWHPALGASRLPRRPLVVVAEGVERPGNLGALVRTACAADADAVLVCDGRTDVFHPDTVRGSVGTIFRVQIAQARTEAALAWLRLTASGRTGRRATAAPRPSSSAASATA